MVNIPVAIDLLDQGLQNIKDYACTKPVKKICDIDTLTLPFLVNNILMIKYDNLSFKYNCKDLQSLLEQTIKDITEFNISLCNESDDVKTVYGLLRESNHLNQQKID